MNVFVKPNEQSETRFSSAMARKRGMKFNKRLWLSWMTDQYVVRMPFPGMLLSAFFIRIKGG